MKNDNKERVWRNYLWLPEEKEDPPSDEHKKAEKLLNEIEIICNYQEGYKSDWWNKDASSYITCLCENYGALEKTNPKKIVIIVEDNQGNCKDRIT